jgi:hypothetical protein
MPLPLPSLQERKKEKKRKRKENPFHLLNTLKPPFPPKSP